MAKRKAPRKAATKIVVVDAEEWAASGGTAGIYGNAWKQGRLKIVDEPGTSAPPRRNS